MSFNSTDENCEEDLNHLLLIDALEKEKKETQDIERIFESISGLEFFKTLFASQASNANDEVYYQLCANMKHEFFEAGKFVFKAGNPSNGKFYVILSGEVGVIIQTQIKGLYDKDKEKIEEIRRTQLNALPSLTHLPSSDGEATPTHSKKLTIRNSMMFPNQNQSNSSNFLNVPSGTMTAQDRRKSSKIAGADTSAKLTLTPTTPTAQSSLGGVFAAKKASRKFGDKMKKKTIQGGPAPADEDEDKHAEYRQMVKRYGNLARVMRKGDSFGETAITQPGTNRTASILCKTDCHFLIIDEQTYKEHLKRTADRKTEVLMKTFSFLTQNEVFGKGDVITMEGPIKEKPYFYVLDIGLCKVEKRFIVEMRNPYSKNEVFHQHCKWVTVCTIGPGTLIGEEILLQPNREEHYEYKVTVLSKSATLLKTDKSFLGIHPDLETPIQQFYQTKKEQRDEIYNNLIQEYYLKERLALKSPDIFLKEHGSLAGALRKSSLDFFSLRSKRSNDNFELNKLLQEAPPNTDRTHLKQQQPEPQKPAKRLSQFPITLNRRETISSTGGGTGALPSLQPVTLTKSKSSISLNRGLTFGGPKANPSQETNGQIPTESDEWQQQSIKPLWTSPDFQETAANASGLEEEEIVDKRPILQMIQTSYSVKKEFLNEKDYNMPKFKHGEDLRVRKGKTIRLVEHHEDLKQKENARQTMQFVAQMNYLNLKEEPELLDVAEIGNFKFVFDESKNTRFHEILKQKHLKHGVFSSRKSINYIQHSDSPAYGMLKRIQQDKVPETTSPIKIKSESSVVPNKIMNSPRETLSSPVLAKPGQNEKQKPLTAQVNVKKLSISLPSSGQYGMIPPLKPGDQSTGTELLSPMGREQFEGSIHFLTTRTQDSGFSTSRTIKSEPPKFDNDATAARSRVPPIHCHSDLPDVSDVCKNQKYTNLVQRSINNKKLFMRKQSMHISRKSSTDAGKPTDLKMKLQASPIFQSPSS